MVKFLDMNNKYLSSKKWDIFFSITKFIKNDKPVEQFLKEYLNLFIQADKLEYGVIWIAESHLSHTAQLANHPIVQCKSFEGEIGIINNVILLIQHAINITKKIDFGTAIVNLHAHNPVLLAESIAQLIITGDFVTTNRKIHLGVSSGRFDYVNQAYGMYPVTALEKECWSVLSEKIYHKKLEIFLTLIQNKVISNGNFKPITLTDKDFQGDQWYSLWNSVKKGQDKELFKITAKGTIEYFNNKILGIQYDDMSVVTNIKLCNQMLLDHLEIYLATENKNLIKKSYKLYSELNLMLLSITSSEFINKMHEYMQIELKNSLWDRYRLPLTIIVIFSDEENPAVDFVEAEIEHYFEMMRESSIEYSKRDMLNDMSAKIKAEKLIKDYWSAVEGTVEHKPSGDKLSNVVFGSPRKIAYDIKMRYPNDKLLLWFDFDNSDMDYVERGMKSFMNNSVRIYDAINDETLEKLKVVYEKLQ